MNQRDLDPEVAADLARRDASEREPARKGCTYDWRPPVIVEHWPCAMGCGRKVGVSQEEIDAFETWNGRLVAQGFAPLPKGMPCSSCKQAAEQQRIDERARALLPRQTEITTTTNNELARYLPTPRKGKRPLR